MRRPWLHPVAAWEGDLAAWLGTRSRWLPLALGMSVSLVALPACASLVCGGLGRLLGGRDVPLRTILVRLTPSLVPIGFAMWLAHFGFHLVTSWGSLAPASARLMQWAGLAEISASPHAGMAMGVGSAGSVGIEIAVLGLGLVFSLGVVWRSSLRLATGPSAALGFAAPWSALVCALYAAGVWILLQPMEMRGMVMG